LRGTVPIFTHKEQYDAHQSFIDWNKLSFFLGFGNKEDGSAQNETSFQIQGKKIICSSQ